MRPCAVGSPSACTSLMNTRSPARLCPPLAPFECAHNYLITSAGRPEQPCRPIRVICSSRLRATHRDGAQKPAPTDVPMFTQVLDPTGNLFTTWVVALIPVVTLLILLAGLRMSAWTYVIDRTGTIIFAYTDVDYRLEKDL